MSESERIENLEWMVRRLAAEVAALRAMVEEVAPGRTTAGRGAPDAAPHLRTAPLAESRPAAEPPPRPAGRTAGYGGQAAWRVADEGTQRTSAPEGGIGFGLGGAAGSAVDVESLIGRYGAMALAALTIMLGVGAFIGWAVEHVRLGPAARVALGAVGAAVVGLFGFVLRRRGARSFGNAMLALALALVHLVAWGAGPSLHVVPEAVALAVVVVASVALAALALREEEEALFVVGLGGSLVAPFVFAKPGSSFLVLLAYGLTLRLAGMHVLRARTWRWGERALAAGGSAYAFASIAAASASPGVPSHLAPALFLLACMTSALVQGGREGRTVALADAASLVVVTAVLGQTAEIGAWAAGVGLAAVGLGYLALHRAGEDEAARGWAWSLLLPGAALAAALSALDSSGARTDALVALAWVGAAGAAAVANVGGARGTHAFVAGAASGLAVGLATSVRPGRTVPHWMQAAALAAGGALLALGGWRARLRGLLASGWLVLFVAWGVGFELLTGRAAWSYAPFLTPESAVMALVTAAVAAAAYATRRVREAEGEEERADWTMAAAPVIAFVWGREELARAFSVEAATFLLIVYYAVAGTVALVVGGRTGRTVARRAGLALAIYAALKALVQAAGLSSVSLRIGSYLLVGCFLLAVAYWYRGGERGRSAEASAA